MICHNTPLTSSLQSPMQMLKSWTVGSQLPMSNAAWDQLGLQTEKIRLKTKNEHLPSHDSCPGQNVMMQDSTSKRWSPAVITKIFPGSYQVTTKDGVTHRKMQSDLKPYRPEKKQDQDTTQKYHMQTLTNECKKDTSSDNLAQSRTRRHIMPPVQLNL